MSRARELAGYVTVSAGMALGASCFAMIGGLFGATSGRGAIVSVVVAAAFCAVVAHAVGGLARLHPSSPGIRTYLKVALGERVSVVLLFMYVGMGVLVAGIETYVLSELVRGLVPGSPPLVTSLGLIALVLAVNMMDIEVPFRFQSGLTLLLVGGLGGLSLWALLSAPTAAVTAVSSAGPTAPSWTELPVAVGLAVFLFVGFEWVTPVGRTREAYERLIPRAMMVAVGGLAVTYLLFVLALAVHVDRETAARTATPHLSLVAALFESPAARWGVAGFSLLAMLTTLNAGLLGASRLVYGVAREGWLPAWCARISAAGAPVGALALLGLLGALASVGVRTSGAYVAAGQVCAAVNCVVYAGLMASSRRLAPKRAPSVLDGLAWPCLIGLLALAAGSLGGPHGGGARVGFAALALVSWIAAEWGRGRRHRLDAARPFVVRGASLSVERAS